MISTFGLRSNIYVDLEITANGKFKDIERYEDP